MAHLEYSTAGESHGPGMVSLVRGMPAGVPLDVEFINGELTRRQGGYGRGGRQAIERDSVEVLSGVRRGMTLGSPIALLIRNRDSRLDDETKTPAVHTPRPGHADMAGAAKYLTDDCRGVLERASARETAARVAAGAVARCMLRALGIDAFAFVRAVHGASTAMPVEPRRLEDLAALRAARDASETGCPDETATERMREEIHRAKVEKTTVGGVIECHVVGVPAGIGSTMDRRERLDARLAGAVMGIQAIKAVEIGDGWAGAGRFGHEVHDAVAATEQGAAGVAYARVSNRAGGVEGGMSNGMPIVLRAAMKPISTVLRGMPSVDLRTGEAATSAYERSDVCAVPAAAVVVENVAAFEVARSLREKFGGDSMDEVRGQWALYVGMQRRGEPVR